MTVPRIELWREQKYSYVPGSVSVTAYFLPAPDSTPSSSAGAPSSLVTVCSIASAFFHTTFVPAGTSSVAGRNRKVLMVTAGFFDLAPADGASTAEPTTPTAATSSERETRTVRVDDGNEVNDGNGA